MINYIFFACILFLGLSILSCSTGKNNFYSKRKVEIIKIDSTRDFYVFTVGKVYDGMKVIAEKGDVSSCQPFKKFIIIDSIQEVSKLKSGSKYVLIGFNELTIGSIKIKNKGELAKIVRNCMSFTN
jgi:hypothetical protein